MKRRRGTSLIELLALMSAASAVLTLGAALVHRTMTAASQGRATRAEETAAWRLAEALRRDAAGATAAEWSADEGLLVLTVPERDSVEYRFAPPEVERRHPQGNGNVALEAWTLESVAGWTVDTASPGVIAVEAEPSSRPTPAAAPVALRVVARLGLSSQGGRP